MLEGQACGLGFPALASLKREVRGRVKRPICETNPIGAFAKPPGEGDNPGAGRVGGLLRATLGRAA